MSFEDDMKEFIREEIYHNFRNAAYGVINKNSDDKEYDEFAWKDNESFEYLCRTGQHLDI